MIRSVSLVAQEIEEMDELLPFDAVIQSEMGGKRMKFYGNTRFNFNQAYFQIGFLEEKVHSHYFMD
jgi:hypothetical protein